MVSPLQQSGLGQVLQGNPEYGTRDVPFTRSGIAEAFRTNPFLNALISGKGLATELREQKQKPLDLMQADAEMIDIDAAPIFPDLEGFTTVDAANQLVQADAGMTDIDSDISSDIAQLQKDLGEKKDQSQVQDEGIAPDVAIDEVGRGDAPAPPEEPQDEVKTDPLEDAFSNAMKAYNEALTGEVSDESIDKYKEQFAKATGIDASGKVDKSRALQAFGLALMQNQAGKGFNVSKLLTGLGEAAEKAEPAMEKARAEARAGQLAAGKFGLEQALADRKEAISAKKDQVTNAYDRIKKRQEDLQEIKLKGLDFAQQRILESEKHNNDILIKELEMRIEDSNKQEENKFKTTDKTKIPTNIQGLDIVMTTSLSDGRSIIVNPDAQVGAFGSALADVIEGENSIDEISSLVRQASQTPGGINVQKLNEIAQGVAASFGYNVNEVPIFNEEGEITGYEIKDKPLTTAKAIRDRIISQYKRFLTQETGNGISNVDIANIERLLGSIDFLKDPADALKRLEQAKIIFTKKKDKLSNVLEKFADEGYYLNTDTFNNTQELLNNAINQAYKFDFGQGPVKDPETGLDVYSLL